MLILFRPLAKKMNNLPNLFLTLRGAKWNGSCSTRRCSCPRFDRLLHNALFLLDEVCHVCYCWCHAVVIIVSRFTIWIKGTVIRAHASEGGKAEREREGEGERGRERKREKRNRSQRCNVNGALSNASEISCGVPQGSVIEPLFFLIYINNVTYYYS